MIILNVAEHGHSNLKRNKAPVQSSHRSGREYENQRPGRKTSIDHPQRYERSARAAPLLNPSVCRSNRTPLITPIIHGVAMTGERKSETKPERRAPNLMFIPGVLRQTIHPQRFISLSIVRSATAVETRFQDTLLKIRYWNQYGQSRCIPQELEETVRSSSRSSAPYISPLVAGSKGAAGT